MKKKLLLLFSLLLVTTTLIILFSRTNLSTKPTDTQVVSSPVVSYPGDFSCQPSECEESIKTGVNGVAYPGCNPLVQINETSASKKDACDYWRTQQSYFGTEEYVDLSTLSKQSKASRGDKIVDGFLGMENEILVHKNAADIFLKAEANFNKLYGTNRIGSTYFLPSYPNGYTFVFSGSLNKRATTTAGSSNNPDGLLYNGEYITPSNHFWGVAIDLNSGTNYGNRQTPGQCSMDIPPEIVTVFESSGLRWGGRYFNDGDLKNYMDPMHFEYVPNCIKRST